MKKFNLILLFIVLITKSLFGMDPLPIKLIKHIKRNGAENIPPALLDKIREQQAARSLTPASILRETGFLPEIQYYEEMKQYLIGLNVPENKIDKYINSKISIHEMCFDNVDPELLRECYMLYIRDEREKQLNRNLLKKELKKINNEGETPLFCALKNPNINFDLISYLLTKKAPLKYPNNPRDTDYNIIIENLINNIDEAGNTILHYSAGFGEITLFKFLIKYNFNINIRNNDGIKAFEILDNQNNSMLHHAAINGDIKLFKILMKEGADINIKNNDGIRAFEIINRQRNNILHFAAINGDRWLINKLIEIGTPTTILNYYGLTPLRLRDRKGNTILHHVATSFNLFAIKNLIEQGSDTEIENHEGLTPLEITDSRKNTLLHYAACVYQDLELTKFFLDLGLNPLEKNIDNQSPIDLAPNEEIANLLKQSSIKTRIMSLFN